MLPTIGLLSVQEEQKIDFQDDSYGSYLEKIDCQDDNSGSHLGFFIEIILAIFDLQVIPMLPTKFQVNWHFCSEEEAKNRFSRWWQVT